jgi:hypothetical protein
MLDSAGLTDPTIQVAATSATQSGPSPMVVKAPAANEHLTVDIAPGQELVFEFNPLDVPSHAIRGDLVFDFPNGGTLILQGFPNGSSPDGSTLVNRRRRGRKATQGMATGEERSLDPRRP